ncbi:MAG: hypothetical protein M0C28_21295 [Candidatus Moduliflexus flocculans]|nr:hypothetical protein [Candidatus Moduliflexus flocculans]
MISFELANRKMFCRDAKPQAGGQLGSDGAGSGCCFPILDDTGILLGAMVAALPINVENIIPNQVHEAFGHDLEAGITLKNLKIISGSDEYLAIAAESAGKILLDVQKGKLTGEK